MDVLVLEITASPCPRNRYAVGDAELLYILQVSAAWHVDVAWPDLVHMRIDMCADIVMAMVRSASTRSTSYDG